MKRKRSIRWRRKLQRGLKTLATLAKSAGYFHHRGIRVRHHGLLVDQPGIAAALDDVAEVMGQRYGHSATLAIMSRITIRYYSHPVLVASGWADQDARWTGGTAFAERGLAKIHYDDKWASRTRVAVGALVALELHGDLREPEVDDTLEAEAASAYEPDNPDHVVH